MNRYCLAMSAAVICAAMLSSCSKSEESGAPASTKSESAAKPDASAKAESTTQTATGGTQYYDEVVGTGPAAAAGKRLRIHYRGTLEDGKKFDSSYDRNEPFTLTLGQGMVIPGWDNGLVGMKVGGKRRLTIPYDQAYGEEGRPPVIPPKSNLIFETELLGVE